MITFSEFQKSISPTNSMKLSQTKIENSLKEISEELKEGWWYNNKNRILKQNGITPKNQIDEENNS